MDDKNRKYDRESLLEIGSQYVRSDKSVRDISEELGVPKTVVSKAKDLYLVYQEGKDEKEQELERKINRLEREIESLSENTTDSRGNRSSSTIDLQDYALDPEELHDEPEDKEDNQVSWGWVAAGVGTLVAMGSAFFKYIRD